MNALPSIKSSAVAAVAATLGIKSVTADMFGAVVKGTRDLTAAESKAARVYESFVAESGLVEMDEDARKAAVAAIVKGAQDVLWSAMPEAGSDQSKARTAFGNKVRNGLNREVTRVMAAAADTGDKTPAPRKSAKTHDERLADIAATVRLAIADGVLIASIDEVIAGVIAEHLSGE